ncbi:MAG: metalloregulator ArsR/SmtB family transcription factor [Chloroflexaceae bacterium]|jgi:ArsR family transcriptional regulator|nr:metalloregulator ArsR/SmtB family transcription factor [Chloroflexaceae bacterium]
MNNTTVPTIELTERSRGSRCCANDSAPRLSAEAAQQLSDDLQLLAHPIRLQILDMLTRREGQVCVCDLEAALPVKQPTVSHHLKLLRAAGLIDCERQGLWAYYFVRRDALAALRARVVGQIAGL